MRVCDQTKVVFNCFSTKAYVVGTPKNTLTEMVPVLDLSLISIASLGPRASTKVESHVNFTESHLIFLQY